jgi:hypothetical protein
MTREPSRKHRVFAIVRGEQEQDTRVPPGGGALKASYTVVCCTGRTTFYFIFSSRFSPSPLLLFWTSLSLSKWFLCSFSFYSDGKTGLPAGRAGDAQKRLNNGERQDRPLTSFFDAYCGCHFYRMNAMIQDCRSYRSMILQENFLPHKLRQNKIWNICLLISVRIWC